MSYERYDFGASVGEFRCLCLMKVLTLASLWENVPVFSNESYGFGVSVGNFDVRV